MITNVHKPIMVIEILSYLNNDKELSILDCTFGGGGHTLSFLDLGHRVTAIDEDLKAQKIGFKGISISSQPFTDDANPNYSVTVSKDLIFDLNGNQMEEDYTFSFTDE